MRKCIFIVYFLAVSKLLFAQGTVENIIIITTDGLRWQEVFRGMDSSIAINKRFNQRDSNYIFRTYWHANQEKRRALLMPFFWGTISQNGSLYGNRDQGTKVNVRNRYHFSYPGYNEIFTGYADTLIDTNEYPDNPHITLPEYLNRQQKFKGKVTAFAAWEAFNRILNEKRSRIPVIAAFDTVAKPNASQRLLNELLRNSFKPWSDHECLDLFTHYAAMENLKTVKPKVLVIGYGETDEWAHAGEYRNYLNAAKQFDKWVADIWSYVQSDAQYRNKTALFITVDHGRGDKTKEQWTAHGASIEGADEIWFAVLSPTVAAKGEVKTFIQLYQDQFAQTLAGLLGLQYLPGHPVGEKIRL